MAFTKKLNVRNSAAIIKEVNQMLESGFPKKETYKVVGAKYNISSKSVQRLMNGQEMDTSKQTLDTSLEASRKHYTSAESRPSNIFVIHFISLGVLFGNGQYFLIFWETLLNSYRGEIKQNETK